MSKLPPAVTIEEHFFADDGRVPNNPSLPLIVYRGTVETGARGGARVRLGGESGATVELHAGDVVVIPAGVAHKNEGASPDLLVVGAYPGGKSPDMCGPTAQHRERALRNIPEVPLPSFDPVYGKPGPLLKRWPAVNGG